MATLSPIPFPPTVPFLGNVLLLDKELPLRTFSLLAEQYGEIYGFKFPDGSVTIHVNSYALVAQLSDDKRFKKVINKPMQEVRNLAGDGLFSAYITEPTWGTAHRILMPAFSTGNVIHMFDDMKDICDQLLMKWERFGSDHVFDPSQDYTRLTFDTIALCSMSYRFNSFYDMSLPTFTQEMVDVLIESSNRAYRSSLAKMLPLLNKSTDEKYFAAIKDMTDTARGIIANRKAHPIEKKDLLNLMLEGRDPKTGEGLSDENIMNNLITFLVAGHETTSGMLSFATYYLLKYPNTLLKLREELDTVISSDEVRLEHLSKLPYLVAVMRETLRLSPTASTRSISAFEDTELIGGDGDPSNPANKKFAIKKDELITVHAFQSMRDPRVWGEDAEEFKPERMLDGKFEKLPFQAWQPFGYGMRGCIGRPFAWQEAQTVLAAIFLKFDVFFADPGYKLQMKQAMTIKPKDFMIRVAPRARPSGTVHRPLLTTNKTTVSTPAPSANAVQGKKPLYVLYGSNTGTSEGFANRIAVGASTHGFAAKLTTLDMATAHILTDGPVVIFTASFEGEPADNAAQFVSWLQNLPKGDKLFKGVKYAIFGCGNREWGRTYQRIPTLIDTLLEKNGAERLVERGEADASTIEFFQAFDEYEPKLWNALEKAYGGDKKPTNIVEQEALDIQIVNAGTSRSKLLRQPDAGMGKVLENRLLTKPGTPEKRHIEIELPDGMAYRAGDYLAILPTNPLGVVKRALAHFSLFGEEEVLIKSEGPTTFPVNTPTSTFQILSGFVELTQPATTRDLQSIQIYAKTDESTQAISNLREHYQEFIAKRCSIIDILEQHKDISLPFSVFLRLLPPMRVRQYSISSSPLVNPQHVTLTVSVIDAPALSGSGERYLGVASNYLATLKPGDLLPVTVRPSNTLFHLPTDPSVPVVMFCAGSGLAPFRGFIQERATQKAAGREVGKMLLFFGCRSPEVDYLYSDGEMGEWMKMGVVDVRPAFSRASTESKGCKYVQDRIAHDSEEVTALFHASAKFFTCGSRKASNGIRDACVTMIKSNRNICEDEAIAQFEKVQKERYATDVFD